MLNLFTVIILYIFVSSTSTLADEKGHQPRHNHGDEHDEHDEHDELSCTRLCFHSIVYALGLPSSHNSAILPRELEPYNPKNYVA